MEKVAYLVNSTPAYYYLLPLHFTLVRRYAPCMKHLFLATEVPSHPICAQVAKDHGVTLIPLDPSKAGFLDSRAAALQQLKGKFEYVLPVQEDFLIDRIPDVNSILDAITLIRDSQCIIASARLMPCPGPKGPVLTTCKEWAAVTSATDEYGFTFQATLWSLDACIAWYSALTEKLEKDWPMATTSVDQRRLIEIRANFAENAEGQQFFWTFFNARKQIHIGWMREGPWSNAVYLSPWPYRPTAIVHGRLESWAEELGKREGVPVKADTVQMESIRELGRGY
jgi:hypothetical protein